MKPDHIGLETMRHSAAHVMAAAVRRLWPDALFDIGPDTAEGFYYDFDLKHRLTVEDFPAIVVIDSEGNNYYEEGQKPYNKLG